MTKLSSKTTIAVCTIGGALLVGGATSGWTQPTPESCSDRTLRGSYAFSIEGLVVRGVAMTTFDGQGNLTQVDHVMVNGVPPTVPWRESTGGTYSVNADCTGVAEIDNAGRPPLDLFFVIARHGTEIHTVVSNAGTTSSSIGIKVE